jgi:polyisoprenoid-binding protein YceI
MVIAKVRGGFGRFHGTIDFDPEQPQAAKVAVQIDAASVDTREPKRDEHLRSPGFFDVAQHPTLGFTSTAVEATGDGGYRVTGDLTIHGVTRPVVLETEYLGLGQDPWGQTRVAFQAKTTINRKDFGLGWNQVLETGGVLVGEKVEIALDVQAVQAQAAAQAA